MEFIDRAALSLEWQLLFTVADLEQQLTSLTAVRPLLTIIPFNLQPRWDNVFNLLNNLTWKCPRLKPTTVVNRLGIIWSRVTVCRWPLFVLLFGRRLMIGGRRGRPAAPC